MDSSEGQRAALVPHEPTEGLHAREVRQKVATLLEPPEQRVGETTHEKATSSTIEREILALLRRPAGYPPGIGDIRHELLPFFSELQIQKAIFSLLDMGLIEIVYTCGFELGFRLNKPDRPTKQRNVYSSNK